MGKLPVLRERMIYQAVIACRVFDCRCSLSDSGSRTMEKRCMERFPEADPLLLRKLLEFLRELPVDKNV